MVETAAPLKQAAIATQPARRRWSLPWSRVILGLFSALVLLYLVAPVAIVIPMSFSAAKYLSFPPPGLSLQWYENFFTRADWTSATIQSIRVAFTVMVLATVLGLQHRSRSCAAHFPEKRLST